MENNSYVLDANIFLEYILERPLGNKSKQILQDAILNNIQVLVPSLLLDEITEVLCGNLDDLGKVQKNLAYIEQLARKKTFKIIVPNTEVRMKSIEIARTGSPQSGFPEWSDSLYHSVAIIGGAIFITNDLKYFRKTQRFGHIQKLADYLPKG